MDLRKIVNATASLFGFGGPCESDLKKVIMVGLDAAGKTTLLYRLAGYQTTTWPRLFPVPASQVETTIPTIGFNVETLQLLRFGYDLVAWDVGGCDKIRPLWRYYLQNCKAMICVIDANDQERFCDAREELHTLLQDSSMNSEMVPLLVVVNKQDLPNAAHELTVCEALGLHALRMRRWAVMSVSAAAGQIVNPLSTQDPFDLAGALIRQLDVLTALTPTTVAATSSGAISSGATTAVLRSVRPATRSDSPVFSRDISAMMKSHSSDTDAETDSESVYSTSTSSSAPASATTLMSTVVSPAATTAAATAATATTATTAAITTATTAATTAATATTTTAATTTAATTASNSRKLLQDWIRRCDDFYMQSTSELPPITTPITTPAPAEESLLQKLESCSLDLWDHFTHIHLAWVLIRKLGFEDGSQAVEEGFKNFILNSGRTSGRSFHATMTRFWCHMIAYTMQLQMQMQMQMQLQMQKQQQLQQQMPMPQASYTTAAATEGNAIVAVSRIVAIREELTFAGFLNFLLEQVDSSTLCNAHHPAAHQHNVTPEQQQQQQQQQQLTQEQQQILPGAVPALWDKKLFSNWYSNAVIFGQDARRGFVDPDLHPLPPLQLL